MLSEDTKAILLLCGDFEKKPTVHPLTLKEYNILARLLRDEQLRPADLFNKNCVEKMAHEANIDIMRLENLLRRGFALSYSLDLWSSSGIWVCCRSDADYPQQYKTTLKDLAPPVLYGCGDKQLLKKSGIAVAGSRKADAQALEFTQKIARLAAYSDIPVISGGARGVDTMAIDTALHEKGIVFAVLADGLLQKSVIPLYRRALAEKRLLLLSSRSPQAHFTIIGAMERNKYIYALAQYACVISAEYKKGGTWSGEYEALQKKYIKNIFVRKDGTEPQGNMKLVALGAIPCPTLSETVNLGDQLEDAVITQSTKQIPPKVEELSLLEPIKNYNHITFVKPKNRDIYFTSSKIEEAVSGQIPQVEIKSEHTEIHSRAYDVVLPLILQYAQQKISLDELADELDLQKTQLSIWLKKAIAENKIKKFSKPTQYQSMNNLR